MTSTSIRSGGERIPAIDALRGIAVFAVLLSHLPFSWAATGEAPRPAFPPLVIRALTYGQYGVHLFLVISGFCIHMAWARQKDLEAHVRFTQFWRRRLHRLYPPYLVALACTLGALYVFHRGHAAVGESIGERFGYTNTAAFTVDLAVLLLLAQNITGAATRVGNGPFWTLALEEQLYALYFVLLRVRRKYGWRTTLLMIAGVTFAWRLLAAALLPDALYDTALLLGPARWLEWALGALAVEIHLGIVRVPDALRSFAVGGALLVAAVGLRVLFHNPITEDPAAPFEEPLFGCAFFVLLNAACTLDVRRFTSWIGRPLVLLGTVSYSLYLTHAPVVVVMKNVGIRLGLGTAGIVALRVLVPIAVSVVFYFLVERRFINAARARRVAERAPAQPS